MFVTLRTSLTWLLFGCLTLILAGCGQALAAPVPTPGGAEPVSEPTALPTLAQVPTEAPTGTILRPQLALTFVSPTITPSPTATRRPTHTPTPLPVETLAPDAMPAELPAGPEARGTAEPTAEPGIRTMRVPIITYHYIRPYPDKALDPLGYNLSVPPEVFDQQLDYLQKQGFTTIRLMDLANAMRTGEPLLPAKPIILTFDDGYIDAYTDAFPLLKKHGMIGTFFIPTNFVEQQRWGYVNWSQLQEMHAGGMEIGGHTLNHADLTRLSAARIEQEVEQSRLALEAHLGDPARVFAYPYGKLNPLVESIVARHYIVAVNSAAGIRHSSDMLYRLHRIQVSGGWDVGGFAYFLNYWLNGPR